MPCLESYLSQNQLLGAITVERMLWPQPKQSSMKAHKSSQVLSGDSANVGQMLLNGLSSSTFFD